MLDHCVPNQKQLERVAKRHPKAVHVVAVCSKDRIRWIVCVSEKAASNLVSANCQCAFQYNLTQIRENKKTKRRNAFGLLSFTPTPDVRLVHDM